MSTPSTNGWTRCPPGSFRRLATNLNARRLRRVWLTRLAWVAGTLLAVAASVGAATAIDSYFSHGRPAAGCAPRAPVTSPSSNPITPPGEAPPQTPGCGR